MTIFDLFPVECASNATWHLKMSLTFRSEVVWMRV